MKNFYHIVSNTLSFIGDESILAANAAASIYYQEQLNTSPAAAHGRELLTKRGFEKDACQLFGVGFDGAHDALVDVKACAKSFFALKNTSVYTHHKIKRNTNSENYKHV